MSQAACGQNKSQKPRISESQEPHFHKGCADSGNEATRGNSLFAPVDLSPSKRIARKRVRRFPSRRQLRALEIGCDELMNLAAYVLRQRPRAVKNLRRAYRRFCGSILDKIERAA